MAEFDPAMNFVANAAVPSYLAYLAKLCRSTPADLRLLLLGLRLHRQPALRRGLAGRPRAIPTGSPSSRANRVCCKCGTTSFSAISLRKGTICGYSPRMRFDLIVNTMYMCCLQRRRDQTSTTRPSGGRFSTCETRCPATCVRSRPTTRSAGLQHRLRQLHRGSGRRPGQGPDGDGSSTGESGSTSSRSPTSGTTR